jgi:hypothetical protein
VSVPDLRSGVVSSLQQAAKIVLAHDCVPGIAIISAMIVSPSSGDRCRAGSKGMWWLYFRRDGKLVGVAIIEAPTLYHARTRVAVRGIGRAVDYSDAKKLDDGDAALVPANCIGRLLLAEEAQQLSDRICTAKADGALRSVEHGD